MVIIKSPKPNVLLLVGGFYQGGSERQAVQLLRLLKESGRYGVNVACLHNTGPLRDEAERLAGGDVAEFPLTSFYDRNAARQLRRFARHLREREIDVVQVFDFYSNVFGMTGAALARVPARVAAKRESDGMRTPTQKRVERQAFRLAHAVAANSEAVRRQLIAEGVPAAKVVTVYNGTDIERVKPMPGLARDEALRAVGLPPAAAGKRLVAIVANMRHPVKDQATFLRAARRVVAEVPDAAFALAGEGGMTEGLRALAAELGLGEQAFFLGRCARVPELLSLSEVCVLSSKGVEGFSNSITEYMAAARPVVATDVGGAREAVVEGETGYIVPPENDEVMAERIASLLKDPVRARAMGERGLQVVKEKFSCRAQLDRTEELYGRLLTAARPRAKAREAGGAGLSEVR